MGRAVACRRARRRLYGFLRRRCGLVDDDAACRCRRRVDRAVELGRVDPDGLLFARHPRADDDAVANWRAVEDIREEAAVFRAHPRYAAPDRFAAALRELLEVKAR